MLLQFIENHGHGLFELGIASLPPGCRIQIDVDIRRNALVLDIELTRIRIENSKSRRGYRTAVHQWRIAANADQAARRFAYQ